MMKPAEPTTLRTEAVRWKWSEAIAVDFFLRSWEDEGKPRGVHHPDYVKSTPPFDPVRNFLFRPGDFRCRFTLSLSNPFKEGVLGAKTMFKCSKHKGLTFCSPSSRTLGLSKPNEWHGLVPDMEMSHGVKGGS